MTENKDNEISLDNVHNNEISSGNTSLIVNNFPLEDDNMTKIEQNTDSDIEKLQNPNLMEDNHISENETNNDFDFDARKELDHK